MLTVIIMNILFSNIFIFTNLFESICSYIYILISFI